MSFWNTISFAGRGERKGIHLHVIYMFTTIPVLAVFFFFFFFFLFSKSLRALLSLSHTHKHHKCNLSYFPYITYNVRLNIIQNIRVQNDKNHRNTKNMAKKHVDFNFLFFSFFFFCRLQRQLPAPYLHALS